MLVLEMMQKMKVMWPTAFGDAQEEWAPVYRKALGQYEGSQLEKAFDAACAKAKYWPRPAEILECIEAPTQRRRSLAPDDEKQRREQYWGDRVMKSDAGKRAISQGFARELWMWAIKNQRDPTTEDLNWMQDRQIRFESERAQISHAKVGNIDTLAFLRMMDKFDAHLCERYG